MLRCICLSGYVKTGCHQFTVHLGIAFTCRTKQEIYSCCSDVELRNLLDIIDRQNRVFVLLCSRHPEDWSNKTRLSGSVCF